MKSIVLSRPIRRPIVCGGRDYNEQLYVFTMLEHINAVGGGFEILIHGGAKGADFHAGKWAQYMQINVAEYKARWKDIMVPGAVVMRNQYGNYNAKAGHDRNQRMIDEARPDALIAFPGGTGTADMVARAIVAKIQLVDLRIPEGTRY